MKRENVAAYGYVFDTPGVARGVPPKTVGVRVYEGAGVLPLVILSAPEGLGQSVSQDVEVIAAEAMLTEYPEEAVRAVADEPWFLLVQHHPAGYDLRAPRHRRREVFEWVEFDDYRITLSRGRRVRDPERALRENTSSAPGVERALFGWPSLRPTTRERVELEAGEILEDI